MTYITNTLSDLEIARGKREGYATVNKFGEALDCDSGVDTDIWDGADGLTSTDIWVPPTAARIHTIVSTSANDAAAGTGMRTVRVCYLPDWDTKEETEDVTMNGVTGVLMVNEAVIIHRMEALTWGTSGVNEGTVTATAAVDGTITAAIQPSSNQTQMCIYGIPSVCGLFVYRFLCEIVKSSLTIKGEGKILSMRDPATNVVNNTAWTNKENFSVDSSKPPWEHEYLNAPKKFFGPGILKLQINTNSNNSKITAAFDAHLVDNSA